MTALPAAPTWAELATTPSALFLDVDGTLLEFEAHPDLVRATESLILLLKAISDSLDGAVALISGRPLSDIDRIFGPWRPPAAGGHGAEVRGRSGIRLHEPDDVLLTDLRDEATQRLGELPGVWVEDKGYGFALHYRALPDQERLVVDLAGRLAEKSDGRLEVQPGAFVQELRPAAYDKGLALDELMAEPPFAGRRPVVVGDDLTDEFAFNAAHRHGGVSVLVGSRDDTVAMYAIPDPEAVRAWLTEIPEEVAQ